MAWAKNETTTLVSTGDSISMDPTTEQKFNVVLNHCIESGTINAQVRFNNDSGSNYANRTTENGASDSTAASSDSIVMHTDTASKDIFSVGYFFSISSEEKLHISQSVDDGGSGAAAPNRFECVNKWANTSDAVTRVDVINDATGDYASDSNASLLGTD
jgi:hypothetical protein